MQPLARELNLSETVFVFAPEAGGDARVRIFTPASSCRSRDTRCLARRSSWAPSAGRESGDARDRRGPVPVACGRRWAGGPSGYGSMHQPIPLGALSARVRAARRARRGAFGPPLEEYVNGPRHVTWSWSSEAAVAALRPDLRALGRARRRMRQLLCGRGHRWKTRMFAPALGVPEDPATGSAAGPLAVHLARHGRIEFGEEIEIRQGAEIGRPSLLQRACGARCSRSSASRWAARRWWSPAASSRSAERRPRLRRVHGRAARHRRPCGAGIAAAYPVGEQFHRHEQDERDHGRGGDIPGPRPEHVEQRAVLGLFAAGTCSCRP